MRATGQSSGGISLKAFREVQRETSPQFSPYNRASDLTIKKISKVEQRRRGGWGQGGAGMLLLLTIMILKRLSGSIYGKYVGNSLMVLGLLNFIIHLKGKRHLRT